MAAASRTSPADEHGFDERCFDCDVRCAADAWISVNHAIFLCIQCAGSHRSLGVHLSYVRSLHLDTIKPQEAAAMSRGGNARFRHFLNGKGVPRHVWLALATDLRYQTPAADLYRRMLTAETEGRALPEEMLAVRPPPPPPPRRGTASGGADWTLDGVASSCELCKRAFWLLQRRHHCRNCGRCVCGACSPATSARPRPQQGEAHPVRHCVLCVPKPARTMPGLAHGGGGSR